MNDFGLNKRLARLFRENFKRTLIVPMDDSLTYGPKFGLENPLNLMNDLVSADVTAVMGYPGSILSTHVESRVERILSTSFTSMYDKGGCKTKGCLIELALESDCVAVSHHVNFGNRYEKDMLRDLTVTVHEAHQVGMPVMCVAYYRPELTDSNKKSCTCEKEFLDKISRCIRMSSELGCDIIKTQMPTTTDMNDNSILIDAAMGAPLVVGGGELKDVNILADRCRGILNLGYRGLCIGRNVFMRQDRHNVLKKLKGVLKYETGNN